MSRAVQCDLTGTGCCRTQVGPTETHFFAEINGTSMVDTNVALYDDCSLEVHGGLLDPGDFDMVHEPGSQQSVPRLRDGNYQVNVPLGAVDNNGLVYSEYASINTDFWEEPEATEAKRGRYETADNRCFVAAYRWSASCSVWRSPQTTEVQVLFSQSLGLGLVLYGATEPRDFMQRLFHGFFVVLALA
jgi:hypothetical protein